MVVLSHRRGTHRGEILRATVAEMSKSGKADNETLRLLNVNDAIASRQLCSEDLTKVLIAEITHGKPVPETQAAIEATQEQAPVISPPPRQKAIAPPRGQRQRNGRQPRREGT
jgi:hypothetical protein